MKAWAWRSMVSFFLGVLLVVVLPQLGHSQGAFPNRPITYINPTPAGTGPDVASRLISKEAEKFLGQPIVVVNKPGASHTIGIAAIAVSKPDGYTIGYTGHPGMFVVPLTEKVPYHPVKDLRQMVQFGQMNVAVTVKGDSPFKSLEDVVAYARQNPGRLTYGSAGTGSMGHLGMELIAKKEGVRFAHIPFKGSPETQAALLGGHVLVGTGDFNPALLEAGQIRLLFLIAESRSTDYPEVPIVKELGYDFPAPTFLNVAGPRGIPEEIVKKLEDAFTRAMKEPAFIKGMKDLRFATPYRNSKELTEYVAQNYDAFGKLLKELGLIK